LKEPFGKFIETELGAGFLLIACGLPGTWKTETTWLLGKTVRPISNIHKEEDNYEH